MMNIVHYIIGLPQYRHGGATKYAASLVLAQKHQNINVSVLLPGDTLCIGNRSRIIKSKHIFHDIPVYEIFNPIVSPLLWGIRNPQYILGHHKTIKETDLENFYNSTRPDILHLHTLMGMPIQILQYLKQKNVKIILTSHDYYGLCPKVNLIDFEGNNCTMPNGEKCAICNREAAGYLKLKLCNSTFFLKYKHCINFHHKRLSVHTEKRIPFKQYLPTTKLIKDYNLLQDYYCRMFSCVNAFHFNSSITLSTYRQLGMNCEFSEVIPITTSEIKDCRKQKYFNHTLQFGYIGGIRASKGFPVLVNTLVRLYNEGYTNWSLNIWDYGLSGIYEGYSNIKFRGGFDSSQLQTVYDSIDVLIVPSVCRETFSLVTLEALSFGTPVIVSDNVGAQDLVRKYNENFVYHDVNGLKILLLKIMEDPTLLEKYNKSILSTKWEFSIEPHAEKILQFYLDVMKL